VQVTFDYSRNNNLVEMEENNQEIEIYHINDKDENGEKVEEGEEVVEKVEINQEETDNVENAVVIDADKFSVYTVFWGNLGAVGAREGTTTFIVQYYASG